MAAPRYGGRRDSSQSDIFKAALKIPGCVPVDLGAVGAGVPDLLIGWQDMNYLCEVKLKPVKGKVFAAHSKLNPKQEEWHENWTGQVAVIRSVEDLYRLLGID